MVQRGQQQSQHDVRSQHGVPQHDGKSEQDALQLGAMLEHVAP
jgi:hypothetical protein